MIVKAFKIITSLLLLGVLAVLVKDRELVTTFKNRLQKETVTIPQEIGAVTEELPTLLQENATPVTTPTPSITKEPETITPTQKVPSIQKEGAYIVMQEGASDTDESYKPAISPCKEPMGFKIGVFDTHFGISRADFIEEINKAGELWGSELNKKLFYYDERGSLTINLIYDERQARTVDIGYLALEIENSKQSAEALRLTYEKEKGAYVAEGESLTQASEAFQEKRKLYTEKVTKYNAEGGAPSGEYEKMMQELESLKQEAVALDGRRDALNAQMPIINAKVARYNELVTYINSLITRSNSMGAKKFTEGRFTPSNNTIDIYQYNDLIKLRRVVAHELGHVLGINHNDDVLSIMYAVNSGTTTVLSKEDLASLHEVCTHN